MNQARQEHEQAVDHTVPETQLALPVKAASAPTLLHRTSKGLKHGGEGRSSSLVARGPASAVNLSEDDKRTDVPLTARYKRKPKKEKQVEVSPSTRQTEGVHGAKGWFEEFTKSSIDGS